MNVSEHRPIIEAAKQRLGLLVIPLDRAQWSAMLASGKWFEVSKIYARCVALGQLEPWCSEADFWATLQEYHADQMWYEVAEKDGVKWVRARDWEKS